MRTVLEVKNLSKKFEESQILSNVSFMVEEGEFVAIMGPSGSGKSTLLYCISGMDRPTSGKVLVSGKDISKMSDEDISVIRLHHMGFIFQHTHLLKNLSIRDNIVLAGFKAGKFTREEVNNKANKLMKKTGISKISGHDIKTVSGGELQRAGICRALINQPDILFADEPTGALNSRATKEVMDIINDINNEGTTVVLVTHDAKVAARASRVIFILDGKIHNEIRMGKYNLNEGDKSQRERKMAMWLEEQGF